MPTIEKPIPLTLDDIPKNARIALLASGGVDSSVALDMLVKAGFQPDLFYIRIGMEDEEGEITCTAEEDIDFVQLLAKKYNLPWKEIDLHKDYWERVVEYTIASVKAGFTPNPDVMCNKLIKFGVFNERVGHSYDYIATGHYAARALYHGKVFLATAPDPIKDQTDFLAQINFDQVSRLLFPLGTLDKKEVRKRAAAAHLPNAHRKDSQGICFLGKINYNQFLERYLGTNPGRIIEYETGKVLGTHRGYWFHTIGQRKGLGLAGGPWFVVKKDCKRNIILVSRGYDPTTQYGSKIYTRQIDFITEDLFIEGGAPNPAPVMFKVRHTPEFTRGLLWHLEDGTYRLDSERPIQGIAPGQFLVLYDTDGYLCFGSGVIERGE